MQRYVLKNQAESETEEDVGAILAEIGVSILDQADGKAVLIEADENMVARLRVALPEWTIVSETDYPLPRPPRVRPPR